ncbi:MAG: type III pantothenate kinase [Candidatus Limnocylindrales bacterium]
MLLVLDVGNTNLTLGLVQDGALLATRRAQTSHAATADELELTLDGLLRLDGTSLADTDAIVCASVVPSITLAVQAVAGRRGLSLLLAAPATVPIDLRVDHPAEVGPDRLVNAMAARDLYGAPAIVVDLGTATTFDVVATDGAYVGGAIAPGLELGLEALAARTARLPRVTVGEPARVIGRDTVTAIQAGAVAGYQSLVSGLLARIRTELAAEDDLPDPAAIPAILTGGLSAAVWARGIAGVDAIDPDLTLKGLALCHAHAFGSPASPERQHAEARP